MKLGESMVSSSEGTRALALELCREFEEKFLRHITGGEVKGFNYLGCETYTCQRNYNCHVNVLSLRLSLMCQQHIL